MRHGHGGQNQAEWRMISTHTFSREAKRFLVCASETLSDQTGNVESFTDFVWHQIPVCCPRERVTRCGAAVHVHPAKQPPWVQTTRVLWLTSLFLPLKHFVCRTVPFPFVRLLRLGPSSGCNRALPRSLTPVMLEITRVIPQFVSARLLWSQI